MQTTHFRPTDLFGVLSILIWLPVALLLAIANRQLEARELPFGIDVALAGIRAAVNLPLSLKRRVGSLAGSAGILDSPRFRTSPQELCKRIDRPDLSGYWICQGPPNNKASLKDCDVVIFWIHGGAYILGNPLMSLAQVLRITELLQAKGVKTGVFSLEYGLAPEHKFPEPFEQGLAAYRYVSQEIDPAKIVICGESAGGHLALTILDHLASKSIPKPAAALLLYPWVDLSNSGKSVARNKKNDMLVAADLDRAVRWACGSDGPTAFADIFDYSTQRPRGYWRDVLPSKTWVGVGSLDLFADSVQDFARHAQDDGCNITLDIWKGKTHGYPAIVDMMTRKQYLMLQPGEDVGPAMPGSKLIAEALLDVLPSHRVSH